tara:strand:- start:3 stop:395 length:393 start_codon:yes stop_codon:yes gene_type:complete
MKSINFYEVKKISLFFLVGLPSYILAVALNYYLVEFIDISVLISYLLVLILQVVINFFLNLKYVFKSNGYKSTLLKFKHFSLSIITVRFLDWSLFALIISLFDIWYLFVQTLNILVFGLIKYVLSKKIFE